DYVLKVLQDVGLVSRKQIDKARPRLDGQNNIVDLLIKGGAVTESDVSRSLAAQAHMDWIDLSTMVIPPAIIKQIRAEDARRFKVIPVAFGETGLVVAVSDPLDIDTIDSLSFLLQRELELVCTSLEKIREALIKYYGTADAAAAKTFAIRHRQPAKNHDRFDEHRRKATATGRTDSGQNQKEADRPARLHYPDQSWRERRHARPRQIESDAWAARAWFFQRRPGN